MPESDAWVLALDHQLLAAVGAREMVHWTETPTRLDVPLSDLWNRRFRTTPALRGTAP
jgi:hypothetical protein